MSVKVMTWVWEHSPVAGNERLVLLAIADCADDEGRNAWPSMRTLAHKTRLDVRTVQRIVRRLQQGGHIAVFPAAGRGGANVYTVLMRSVDIAGDAAVETAATPGKLPGRQNATPRHRCHPPPGTSAGGPPAQVPPKRPYVLEPPPPSAPPTAAAPIELERQAVVVEETPKHQTDQPAQGEATTSPADDEAMTIVARAQWPATLTATAHRLLAGTVRACLDRGHPRRAIEAALTDLDGARSPVAVAVARLRDLAAAAPATEADQDGKSNERSRLARTPHTYVDTESRLCGACGWPEFARVHGLESPRCSTSRCEHGRQPVACPACRHSGS